MNSKLAGHLLVLFCVLVWGVTFVSTKVLLGVRSPVEIAFDRFVLAFLVLCVLHPRFAWQAPREELRFFGLGLCGVTLYFLFENFALQYTQASNVGLLVSSAPLLTAIFAHYITHEQKLSRQFVLGSLLALLGVAVVMFNGSVVLKLNPLGDLLALLAGAAWALYCLQLRKMGDKYGYLYLTRQVFFYGLLTMLPALYFTHYRLDLGLWLSASAGNMLFLGVVASAVCYVAWNKAVNLIGSVKASNYIYLIPVVTLITAVLALGERLTLIGLTGAAFILCGVYYAEHGFKLPSGQ
ncbi:MULTISPECIES: DMT family transporter [Chitinibacter]|uniref:DMT family transporter n=1 Tax=Chitinibacter TaxID=230666 RepID=UPI000647795B|nr:MULTISPECIES: DMT family transporter [Chitinibacter]